MRMTILIQALQSEGVLDSAIRDALVKAELYNMEMVVQNRISKAMYQVEDTPNPFTRSPVLHRAKAAI